MTIKPSIFLPHQTLKAALPHHGLSHPSNQDSPLKPPQPCCIRVRALLQRAPPLPFGHPGLCTYLPSFTGICNLQTFKSPNSTCERSQGPTCNQSFQPPSLFLELGLRSQEPIFSRPPPASDQEPTPSNLNPTWDLGLVHFTPGTLNFHLPVPLPTMESNLQIPRLSRNSALHILDCPVPQSLPLKSPGLSRPVNIASDLRTLGPQPWAHQTPVVWEISFFLLYPLEPTPSASCPKDP